jgi:transcriptional regulator with XRE-family HTH domain
VHYRAVRAVESNERSELTSRLVAGRMRRGLSKRELARRIAGHVEDQCPAVETLLSYVKRWESGKSGVSERYRFAYAAALGVEPADLFGPEERDWDDMERRRLLLLAALGLGAGALAPGEQVRQLLDLTLASEQRDVDDWELACADHLHALRTQPPDRVRAALVVDLLAVHRQLRRPGAADKDDLQRVVAALSTLHANVLTRLGEHGAAIHWWRTARTAASRSGDSELLLGVSATEAGHGLYGQRAPETVLRLTQKAQRLSGGAPSLGRALVVCSEAKALMLLGQRDEAVRTLNVYRDLAASAPEPHGIMPGYWQGGQLQFAENTILAGVGDEAGAEIAGRKVLATAHNPDYQNATQVRLHRALCAVVNGGTAEGACYAARVLDAVPVGFRSQMITETGWRVLRAVPCEDRELPAVREFQEVLSATAPARALPSR